MKCFYCHTTQNLTKDHIAPKCKGGTNSRKNIRILCEYCNTMKGAMRESDIERLFLWFKYIELNRQHPLLYDAVLHRRMLEDVARTTRPAQ